MASWLLTIGKLLAPWRLLLDHCLVKPAHMYSMYMLLSLHSIQYPPMKPGFSIGSIHVGSRWRGCCIGRIGWIWFQNQQLSMDLTCRVAAPTTTTWARLTNRKPKSNLRSNDEVRLNPWSLESFDYWLCRNIVWISVWALSDLGYVHWISNKFTAVPSHVLDWRATLN